MRLRVMSLETRAEGKPALGALGRLHALIARPSHGDVARRPAGTIRSSWSTACSLRALVFVLMLPGSSASGQPVTPAEPPLDHGVIKCAYRLPGPSSGWRIEDAEEGQPIRLASFNEHGIWIFYGVKPAAYRVGAITIKVSRFFHSTDPMLVGRVALYRGNGFLDPSGQLVERQELPAVSFDAYQRYHKKATLLSETLHNGFHQRYRLIDQARTDEPEWRAELFLFREPTLQAPLRKSYLLRYESGKEGTWIPAQIGTGSSQVEASALSRIELAISDILEREYAAFRQLETAP